MNIIELLKTLRIRDKQIAESLGVKVAQLNRRQKQIQQPSDESVQQLRMYAKDLIHRLQTLVLEAESEEPTDTHTKEDISQSEEIPNEGKPQTDDINETKIKVKSKKK